MQVPFRPMEPERRDEPFDSAEHLFQVKWDGVRCVVLAAGGTVRLFSRQGHERTDRYPELQDLAGRLPGNERCVLDGELVALAGGRPSFFRILERESVRSPAAVAAAVRRVPVLFVAFDLLQHGDDLLDRPLQQRLQRLTAICRPGGSLMLSESVAKRGRDLFAAVCEQQLEGVVAKRLGSPYRVGARSADWIKIKRRLRQLCVVGGYLQRRGKPTSLLVGAHDAGGRLRYLGRVGSGLSTAELALVADHAPPAACPFDPPPGSLRGRFDRGEPGEAVWVQPMLTLWVRFNEWTPDLRLRSPVALGWADAAPAASRLP